ncbi:MAG: hypothetical protein HY275_00780 [Gemmatimonadetes bacterium]|nr:hypothetical protein [Gemmatimonadota bacterium]
MADRSSDGACWTRPVVVMSEAAREPSRGMPTDASSAPATPSSAAPVATSAPTSTPASAADLVRRAGTPARDLAPWFEDPVPHECPLCGSDRIIQRNCKVLCGSCRAIIQSCADL